MMKTLFGGRIKMYADNSCAIGHIAVKFVFCRSRKKDDPFYVSWGFHVEYLPHQQEFTVRSGNPLFSFSFQIWSLRK